MIAGTLGELVTACRGKGLPAISAMVVRFRERVPGPGYYPVAHPEVADDEGKRMLAWAIKLEKARSTTYPPSL